MTTCLLTSKSPSRPLAGTSSYPSMTDSKKNRWNLIPLTFVICHIYIYCCGPSLILVGLQPQLSHQHIQLDCLCCSPCITFLFLSGFILIFKRLLWGRQGIASPSGPVTQNADIFTGHSSFIIAISLLLCQIHYVLCFCTSEAFTF